MYSFFEPGGRVQDEVGDRARQVTRRLWHKAASLYVKALHSSLARGQIWFRTNGVNTNGATAKVMQFDRSGKKVRPGTFGKINIG